MFRISVHGSKGGVGKSTISLSLAKELALDGKNVLLIDRDVLGYASFILGVKGPGLLAKIVEGTDSSPVKEIRIGNGILTVLKLFGDGTRFKNDIAIIHSDPSLKEKLKQNYKEILNKRVYDFAVVDNLPLVTPSDYAVKHELSTFLEVFPNSTIARVFVSDPSKYCIINTANYIRTVEGSPEVVGFPWSFVINMFPPRRETGEYVNNLRDLVKQLGLKSGVIIPFVDSLFQFMGDLESLPVVPQIRRMALNIQSGHFDELIV